MRLGDDVLLVIDVGLVLRGRLSGEVGSDFLLILPCTLGPLLADPWSSLASSVGVSSDRGFLVAFFFAAGRATAAGSRGFIRRRP